MSRLSAILPAVTLAVGFSTLLRSLTAEELPVPVSRRSSLHALEEIPRPLSSSVRKSRQSGEGELITERYPNRAVKLQRHVIQDAQRNYINHGSWTLFDPQARVLAQGEYRHGKRHGSWTRIMPEFVMADPQFRGPFTSQAEFEDGQLHGAWTILDAQQRVVGSWQFSQGQLDGASTTWYPNGQQRREMKFERGVPSGEAFAWKPDGSVWAKEYFRDGRQLVPTVTWHDRQQKESEGWYVRSNFAIHANADWWNGVLEITREDNDGEDVKTGEWTEWYANGTRRFEGTFENGKPIREHTWWHPNGQRMLAGNYEAGLSEGLWTRWHPTGMKQEEGTYLAGVKTGTWTTWSEDGLVADVQDMSSETAIAADTEGDDPIQQNVSHILLNDPPRPAGRD